MTKLYICNTTNQRWHQSFRVPDMPRPYYVQVPPGSQVEVSSNLGPESHKAIVQQIERFGGRPASAVHGKLEKFPGLFYRFDKPIGVDEIHAGNAAVVDAAGKRAGAAFSTSALALDAAQRDKSGHRMVRETELEVTEQVKPGSRPTGKEVKAKIGVSPDGSNRVNLKMA
jgi:hypothetical protein